MALHCAATLLLARLGDEQWTRSVAERVRAEHVARVWSGSAPAARAQARLAAGLLGVDAVVLAGVEPEAAGSTGADGAYRAALDEIADLHRGETVLVLTGHVEHDLQRLEIGDDGWRVLP